jgi:glycosyltransferase involved in cell wall biosynthesis
MRIALVHKDLCRDSRGGICTLYRNLATQLLARGHQVYTLSRHADHGVDGPGATPVTVEGEGEPRLDAVAERLRAIRPDVVECSTWEYELLHYARRPRRERAPVVVRCDLTARTLGAAAMVEGERELVRRSDLNVAVSRFAGRDVEAAYGVPVPEVVANGVDADLFVPAAARSVLELRSGWRLWLGADGVPVRREPLAPSVRALHEWLDGKPTVLWCGKITPMKGWDVLEGAVRALEGRARFVVLLGHSPALCPLTIAEHPDVVFLQDLANHDVPKLLAAADFVLSTSRWEGFGLSIVEALACGATVLVPDTLEVARELIVPGRTGHTFGTLAELRALVLGGRRLRGQAPPEFRWDVNCERSLALYRSLLPRAAARTASRSRRSAATLPGGAASGSIS